jgi:hypothetical protein
MWSASDFISNFRGRENGRDALRSGIPNGERKDGARLLE